MYTLTGSQNQFAEEHHYLIKSFLRTYRLEDLDGAMSVDNSLTLAEVIGSGAQRSEDIVIKRLIIEEAMFHMTEKEKHVVKMKAEGFTGSEIGALYGITASGIYSMFYRMRKRLRLAMV